MTHSHKSKRDRRLRLIRHEVEGSVETPIFLGVLADTPTKELPTFEENEGHAGFLHRHDFHRWLLDLLDRARR